MDKCLFNCKLKVKTAGLYFALIVILTLSVTPSASALQCSQILSGTSSNVRTPEVLLSQAEQDTIRNLRSFNIDDSSFERTPTGASGARVGLLINPETQSSLRVVRKADAAENRQSSTSEVLAYSLSKIVGLEKFMPVVQRVVDGHIESFQVFYAGGISLDQYSYHNYGNTAFFKKVEVELSKHTVFDFIIGDILDGRKDEHKIIEPGISVISIDKGDAFSSHTYFPRGLERSFSAFFETPGGMVFRDDLKKNFNAIMSETKRVLGENSPLTEAVFERLTNVLNIRRLSELPKEQTQIEIDFDRTLGGLIDRFVDNPGELSSESSSSSIREYVSLFNLSKTNMPKIIELLIKLDLQRSSNSELNMGAVRFISEQLQFLHDGDLEQLNEFRGSLNLD